MASRLMLFLAVACLDAGVMSVSYGALPGFAIRNWQVEQGLPQNTVTTILQTRDGYLWLGTLSGLVRFDGARFVNYDTDRYPQLVNGRITALFEAADGALWIGHETGQVTRMAHGSFETVQLPENWGHDIIASIVADARGTIWASSRKGRLLTVPAGKVVLPPPGPVRGFDHATIALDRDGVLWANPSGLLGYLKGGQWVEAAQPSVSEIDYVQTFTPARRGGLWVLRAGRLFHFENGRWQADGTCDELLISANGALELEGGLVAVRTTAQGLWIIQPGVAARNISRGDGLGTDWLGSLAEDREGNLWAGSANAGLFLLSPARFQRLAPPDGWRGGVAVLGLAVGREGRLWAGTEGAGLYLLEGNQWTRFASEQGLENEFVWTVAEVDGRAWAGTWGGGLFRQEGSRFGRAPGWENIRAPITALLPAAEGGFWVGTRDGLVRYQQGRLETVAALPDVRSLAQGPDGTLWFGTMGNGLGSWRDGQTRVFRKADGLSSDFLLCLYQEDPDTLWIGTSGGGLNRLRGGKFSRVGAAEGLPSSIISYLMPDDQGHFWIASAGGIFRVSRRELHDCADGLTNTVRGVAYGLYDGLPTTECSGGFQSAGARTPDGRLLFPLRKGMVTVDPTRFSLNRVPPPVLLEEVVADGKVLWTASSNRTGSALKVPPGVERLELLFTALSLTSPEKVRFRYRLQGLDRDWVEGADHRSVSYSLLAPRDYVFHVSACNNDGLWNETGATLALTVLPHFWQTWWFRGLTYVVSIALVTGLVLAESRRRHRAKLERIERQRALERERARIAKDIHDDLGATLTRISLLSQSAPAGENEPARQQLEAIYTTTRDLTRSMDEIVWAVSPEHDTLDSVVTYLTRFAQGFLQSAGIRCRLDLPIETPSWPLTAEVRHNLFLAFKEALNNIVKHSGASEVRFAVTLAPEAAVFSLQDNGHGLNGSSPSPHPDRASAGHGLGNMRSRMQAVGGLVEWEDRPGQGTTVRLTIHPGIAPPGH